MVAELKNEGIDGRAHQRVEPKAVLDTTPGHPQDPDTFRVECLFRVKSVLRQTLVC